MLQPKVMVVMLTDICDGFWDAMMRLKLMFMSPVLVPTKDISDW